jgi:hypothetical protein
MHCIIFLHPDSKLRTPEQIDSLLSSEFPEDNPELLEKIKKFMVHSPVVLRIQMLHACRMAGAPRTFPSLSEIRPQFLRIPMPLPGVGTLARHITFVESRLTIAGSSLSVPISSGSMTVISI